MFPSRHAIGDWGELEPADVAENEYSVAHGFRLLERHLQKPMTEPAQGEMSPAMPEAVAKTNGTKKMRQVLPVPTGIGAFFSEWYLVPEASFALMPLPLVIQYRLKARKLSICPSQGIYVQASRPGLNKIPFQLVQLFANHKTNSYADRAFNAKRKAN